MNFKFDQINLILMPSRLDLPNTYSSWIGGLPSTGLNFVYAQNGECFTQITISINGDYIHAISFYTSENRKIDWIGNVEGTQQTISYTNNGEKK